MKPDEHLPLAPRDFLILLILARGDRHGYGIVKDAEVHGDRRVTLDPANLYRSMKRLTRDGLVADVGERATGESEGAPRRYYRLTPFGRRVLASEAARLARLTDTARAWRILPAEGGSSG